MFSTPTMSLVSPHCDVIDELPVLSRLKNAARVLTRLHTGIEGFTLESLWCISGIIEKIAMHLNIKDDEAHRLATELARLTGESLTSAVTSALRERLAREHRRRRTDDVAARLMKIGNRYAALPDTGRTPDEILGYDEQGLPK